MPGNNSERAKKPKRASGEFKECVVRLSVTHIRRPGMMKMMYTLTAPEVIPGESPLIADCDAIGVDQVFESIKNLHECRDNGLYKVERCDVDVDDKGRPTDWGYRLVIWQHERKN